jgi:hypothetical protein
MKCVTAPETMFPKLHRRMVAVQLPALGRDDFLKGRAYYENDANLGPVLRIALPQEDGTELIFTEQDWTGEVISGTAADFEFLLCVN